MSGHVCNCETCDAGRAPSSAPLPASSQQQAAELPPATLLDRMLFQTGYEQGCADEAARWQAKIEALAVDATDSALQEGHWRASHRYYARRLRALLDGDR